MYFFVTYSAQKNERENMKMAGRTIDYVRHAL